MTDFAAHAGTARRMPMGTGCAVHRHDAWVPIERHHVWPLGLGGPDVEANKIPVCANGHYAIHELLDRLLKSGGQVPWAERRHFGPRVRHYAQLGYERATHRGDLR